MINYRFLILILLAVQVAWSQEKLPKKTSIESALKLVPGDEKGNEIKELKTELLVTKSENAALKQLQYLSKKHKGTRLEPDIKLRLAEMYMRRARTHRFFEVNRDSSTIFKSLRFFPDVVKGGSERQQIKQSIDIYQEIQTKFPYFRQMDLVVFNSGYAYQQLGDEKGAEGRYRHLIKTYPDSPLVPDSLLAVSEILYQQRNFQEALVFLRDLRKFPNSRSYPYGLYKTAWCYYNMQDTKQGLKWLEEVMKYGKSLSERGADRRLDLRKEALNDMALFYADSQPAANAVSYFTTQAGDLGATATLMRLVELYKSHSRFKDIDVVLTDMLEKSSTVAELQNTEALSQVYDELIWNSDKVKNQKKAVSWLVKYAEYCTGAKKDKSSCTANMVETSRKLATKWHAQWSALNKEVKLVDQSLLSAETAYAMYIQSATPSATGYPDVRFSYAELLFVIKKYRLASEMYSGVELKALKDKERHTCAYGAIVALERAVEVEKHTKWTDQDEKQFTRLADRYLGLYPNSEHAIEVRFSKSFIAYEKGRYDEAAIGFKDIGWSTKQSHSKVLKAQDLYLDILNLKKDYKTLREASALLLKRPGDSKRTEQLGKIYREAYFSEIQQMEEKGKTAQAVQAYLQYARENSKHELGVKAWWNATQLQFKSGDFEGGAINCEKMFELFSAAVQTRDCLSRAAQIFEAMGNVDRAAGVAQSLAKLQPESAPKWQEFSADLMSLSHRSQSRQESVKAYHSMTMQKGTRTDRVESLIAKIHAIAEETGDRSTKNLVERLATQHQVQTFLAESYIEQAETQFKQKDFNQAFGMAKKVIARSDWPKAVLARARFLQGQVLEDEYRKQSVKARADRLGTVLALKTEKLEKVQQAYQGTVQYGSHETSVRALKRLADCYFEYSESVRKSAQIAGLTPEESKALQGEVEQLAIPMEEKGIDTLVQALNLAKRARLRNGLAADIDDDLNKRNMRETERRVRVVEPGILVPSINKFMLGFR